VDLTVAQKISESREINNIHISMEGMLDDNQIVKTVLAEQLEHKQNNPDDSDKELLKIFTTEGLNRLKTFILFAKQINNDFF
ncbi:1031_t:CDS:1, partial [Dentiscutata heterogama]